MPIGPLMIDLKGTEINEDEKELLQHPLVGGIILFSRNFYSLEQLQQLIFCLRNLRREPLLIAIDHEGGRVQRFHEGFSSLPSCSAYGKFYDKNPALALTLTENAGWLMAAELLSMGIDLSFAPVLDLDTGQSVVIGNRAFHSDPEKVVTLTSAFIQGMREAGMVATGKHFPGHGSVAADSHVAIPVDERDFATILAHDMIPFAKLASNALGAIMPAHVIYSKVDPKPVTFSSYWLQDVLRQQLHFSGAIISDDLSMVGATVINAYEERVLVALKAGCDMVLVCNNAQGVTRVIEALSNYQNPLASQRLLKLCGYFQVTRNELYSSERWRESRSALEVFEKEI